MSLDLSLECEVECPYCGHLNRVLENETNGIVVELAKCDLEDNGGCEAYFVLKTEVILTAKAYKINKKEEL